MSSKRRASEQSPTQPRKRNRPFATPKDPKIKALFKRNAAESALLHLPQELRDKIINYVFEPRILHIRRNGNPETKFRYESNPSDPRIRSCSYNGDSRYPGPLSRLSSTCFETAYSPDAKAEEKCFEDFDKGFDINTYEFGHLCDYSVPKSRLLSDLPLREIADVRLFRTCRQFYHEAFPAFWQQTMFSFQSNYTFAQFILARTAAQKALIRRLRLAFCGLGFRETLPPSIVLSLTGLRTLYIHASIYGDVAFDDIKQGGILRFSMLPLQTVKVHLSRHYGKGSTLRVAHSIRDKLLDEHCVQTLQQYRENAETRRFQKRESAAIRQKKKCAMVTKAKCDGYRRGLVKRAQRSGKLDAQVCDARHRCAICNKWEHGIRLRGVCDCNSTGANQEAAT